MNALLIMAIVQIKNRLMESGAFVSVILLTAILIGVSACSTISSAACEVTRSSTKVTIEAMKNANHDSAVAVDVVIIDAKVLAEDISKMAAHEYFAQRRQIQRDNPEGLTVWSWELAPGQQVDGASIGPLCGSATLVFASYVTPGDHRLNIDRKTEVRIVLGERDFSES